MRHPSRFNLPDFLSRGTALLLLAITVAGCGDVSRQPAPFTHLGIQTDAPAGAAIVLQDDTLWKIAQRYQLPVRGIIDANGLSPPYVISEGQRLRLPPPLEHRAEAGDTLHMLARMYGVPVSQLVKNNKIQSPYFLRVGQVLRIPAAGGKSNTEIIARKQEASPKAAVVGIAEPAMNKSEAERFFYPEKKLTPSREEKPVVPFFSRQEFTWPVRGRVISSYGPKEGGLYNDGINIAAPRGAPVSAAADGTVVYAGDGLESYGNLVLLRHASGMVTAYAHLNTIQVHKGMHLRRGQTVGTVGSTGTVANSQLHFEVRKGAETLDPVKYLG